MRLIDADALRIVFTEKSSERVCGVELCKAIIFRIDEAPTIDAVPVIRCKDCKYWKYEDSGIDGTAQGKCCSLGVLTDGMYYCADAERKEE